MVLNKKTLLLYDMDHIEWLFYSNTGGIPQIFSYENITIVIIIAYGRYRETICSIYIRYCVFFPISSQIETWMRVINLLPFACLIV